MSKPVRPPSAKKSAQQKEPQKLANFGLIGTQSTKKTVRVTGTTVTAKQKTVEETPEHPDTHHAAPLVLRRQESGVAAGSDRGASLEAHEVDDEWELWAHPSVDGPPRSSVFAELVEKFAANRNDAIVAIRKGFPASVLKEASEYFEVPVSKIRTIVRLPESTAARLVQKQAAVDASVSERIWRLADVAHMAIDVFEDDAAAKSWLRSPNRTFMNTPPMDYLDTEPGAMSVRQVLNAIATGGAA
ncbi:DUF2384 domain-containing protein [Massilia sp. PAMC28688]|uniref:type II RES/Xre toxin-antitoxin system antitoxin n=1 Tax=Massilia sp. PAMC28688 TaxID=2861283 RepID=UPI001C62D23B|nr:antitoxin Xre/MbcA/ParS toxin-binding domain-containing protein [Massilia sp. PAMC28688]QYF92584.1 DUF2384 domain-containing protein [Massilia sp. PAMC28688]